MFTRFDRRGWHYALLLAAAFGLFFVNLGGATLWDLDEGRNATCSLEMMEAGNWVVPTFNGILRVHKPALNYWLQITAYRLFGVNEFAARLPSAIAAALTVLLCYELARAMFGKATGLLAGFILASTPMLTGAARFANQDALLDLFAVLTFLIYWHAKDRPTTLAFAALGISTGLGVLAKGPVGVALPGVIILLHLVWERRLRVVWDLRATAGIWTLLLVALPWYVWVAVDTKGEFIRQFFFEHNVGRFTSPMENHRGSPLYYVMVLLAGMAPWSVFFAPVLWYSVWSTARSPWERFRRAWDDAAEKAPEGEVVRHPATAYRLLACWAVVYVVFFTTAATKLPNYILPAVPPCAILAARFLERWRRGELRSPGWVIGASSLALLLIGVGLAVALAVVGGAGPGDLLRGRYLSGLEAWAALGIVPLIGGTLAWRMLYQQRRTAFVAVLAATAFGLVAPLAAYGNAFFNRFKPVQPLVEAAGALRRDDDIRVGGWDVQYLPSLNFYVQRAVHHLHTDEELREFLNYPLHVYVFIPARHWELRRGWFGPSVRVVGRHRDLYRNQEVLVVTNR